MKNQIQNQIVCFTLPKIGEPESGIQDACKYSLDCSLAAIADGASTSVFPKEWALLLVGHFCQHNEASIKSIYSQWEKWLRPVQEQWRQHCIQVRQNPNAPWNVKAIRKVDCGSATFVGLNFKPKNKSGQKIWEILAVGDSCVFHIKANKAKLSPVQRVEVVSLPISKSENFKTVTDCFHSLPEYKSSPPNFWEGYYEDGDIFLLATDALAEWIIKNREEGNSGWQKLIEIANKEEFSRFIEQLRHDNLIKNDDTTLCRINVGVSSGLSLSSSKEVRPDRASRRYDDDRILFGLQIVGSITFIHLLITVLIVIPIAFSFFQKTSDNLYEYINQQAAPKNSNPPTAKAVPIYANAGIDSSAKLIGYLKKRPSQSDSYSLQLWAHIPLNYMRGSKLTIPADSTQIDLYLHPLLSEQDFLLSDFESHGYLLPEVTCDFEEPRNSNTENYRWVKVTLKLAP